MATNLEINQQNKMHSTEDDHSLAEPDKLPLPTIVFMIILTSIVIIVVVVGVFEFIKYRFHGEIWKKINEKEGTEVKDLRAIELSKFNRYQWVDKKNNVLRIPLDKAKELTLRDWPNRPIGLVPVSANSAVVTIPSTVHSQNAPMGSPATSTSLAVPAPSVSVQHP